LANANIRYKCELVNKKSDINELLDISLLEKSIFEYQNALKINPLPHIEKNLLRTRFFLYNIKVLINKKSINQGYSLCNTKCKKLAQLYNDFFLTDKFNAKFYVNPASSDIRDQISCDELTNIFNSF
jgi:hypothetical protein